MGDAGAAETLPSLVVGQSKREEQTMQHVGGIRATTTHPLVLTSWRGKCSSLAVAMPRSPGGTASLRRAGDFIFLSISV